MSFYFWVCASLVYFVCVFCYLLYTFYGSSNDSDVRVRRLLIQKLIGYPVIIVICWTIGMVYDIHSYVDPYHSLTSNYKLELFYTVLPTIQGLMTATLFFFQYIKKKIVGGTTPQNTVAVSPLPLPRNTPNLNRTNTPVTKGIQLAVISNTANTQKQAVVIKPDDSGVKLNSKSNKDLRNNDDSNKHIVKASSPAEEKKFKETSQEGLRMDGNNHGFGKDAILGDFVIQQDLFALEEMNGMLALGESGQRKHFNSLESAIPNRRYRPDNPSAILSKESQYLEIDELHTPVEGPHEGTSFTTSHAPAPDGFV